MGGCDEEIENENKVARVRAEGGGRGNMVRIAKHKDHLRWHIET